MDCENRPIQVIALCGAEGELKPRRFLIEARAPPLHTVSGTEVADTRWENYAGIEAAVFLCRAVEAGREQLYELKYTVRTHRWVLFRRIY